VKNIILISLVTLFINSSLVASNNDLWPMLKISYDMNLGLTFSVGLSILNYERSTGKGIYVLASKGRKGSNISFGALGAAGGFYGTYGLNRMKVNKDNNISFWGLEMSTNFLLHYKIGLMNKNKLLKISDYKFNLAAGLGI